ncbi:hypothetical protein C8Q76DRAFT_158956 [Earliella scabrosa]|nr:hypothetical protein C8Q76DRAFT_158956 [Earliella scabrosa]
MAHIVASLVVIRSWRTSLTGLSCSVSESALRRTHSRVLLQLSSLLSQFYIPSSVSSLQGARISPRLKDTL